MEKFEFSYVAEGAGRRLDVFIVEKFGSKYSRTFVKKLIDAGRVLVNGGAENAHYHLKPGDAVAVEVPDAEAVKLEPENISVEIVYEDEDVVVVNKQAGLVVHPAPGNYSGTLVNALLYHCRSLSGVGGELRPGVVHRLDKDTTGLIVAAKTDTAHRSLAAQFKAKTAGRTYIALVKGIVELDNGIIDLPIGRHFMERQKMGVEFSEGRESRTHYSVLRRFKDFTMLELRLETGRTHQIRVHMAHLGYPVIGDKTYGSGKGLGRQALHAKKLAFVHPRTKKAMEFDTDIPADMAAVIARGRL